MINLQKNHDEELLISIQTVHIQPNYRTVRLGFSKILGKFVVKYVPTYTKGALWKKKKKKKKKDQHWTYQMMIMQCFCVCLFNFL